MSYPFSQLTCNHCNPVVERFCWCLHVDELGQNERDPSKVYNLNVIYKMKVNSGAERIRSLTSLAMSRMWTA